MEPIAGCKVKRWKTVLLKEFDSIGFVHLRSKTWARHICRTDNRRTYALLLTQDRDKLQLTASESYPNTFDCIIYQTVRLFSVQWYHINEELEAYGTKQCDIMWYYLSIG